MAVEIQVSIHTTSTLPGREVREAITYTPSQETVNDFLARVKDALERAVGEATGRAGE